MFILRYQSNFLFCILTIALQLSKSIICPITQFTNRIIGKILDLSKRSIVVYINDIYLEMMRNFSTTRDAPVSFILFNLLNSGHIRPLKADCLMAVFYMVSASINKYLNLSGIQYIVLVNKGHILTKKFCC